MRCDEIGEVLPEHLLGSLPPDQDREVRLHLRGCAGCRTEMAALDEGVASFARAAHDRTPPAGLDERLIATLEQEWRDTVDKRPQTSRSSRIGRAAAVVAVVAALGWGLVQTQRANVAAADARSYSNLLNILGGKEFRVGELRSQTGHPLDGSVVLYDSHRGQSWGIVLVHAPGVAGEATVTLSSDDRRTIDAGTIEFQPDGDAATWLVTSSDLTAFDHVTVTADDGTVLASAEIAPA